MRALVVFALLGISVAVGFAQTVAPPPFDEWLAELLVEARARGYSEEILTQTLVGLTPLPRVIASDRRQPELAIPFAEYVRRRVTPALVRRGRELASRSGASRRTSDGTAATSPCSRPSRRSRGSLGAPRSSARSSSTRSPW